MIHVVRILHALVWNARIDINGQFELLQGGPCRHSLVLEVDLHVVLDVQLRNSSRRHQHNLDSVLVEFLEPVTIREPEQVLLVLLVERFVQRHLDVHAYLSIYCLTRSLE